MLTDNAIPDERIRAERDMDAAEFGGMIGAHCPPAHAFDHEWDDWRYVEDCGCSACVMWEVWVTGWNHPGIDDENDWWQWTEQGAER